MRIRLNEWQRIGIVLSVVWFVAGYNCGRDEIFNKLVRIANLGHQACLSGTTDPAVCYAEFVKDYPDERDALYWENGLIMGLVPIPFAWLVVYAFIGLWRWIRRGFNT
jgi:hypothetical protein